MAYATHRSDRTGATTTIEAGDYTEAIRKLASLIGITPGTITVRDGNFEHQFPVYRT